MIERLKIIWYGKPPTTADIAEAANRGLSIELQRAGDVPPDFKYARGMVFWATQPHFGTAVAALEASIPAAIDHGLYLHIVVGGDAQRVHMVEVLKDLLPAGLVDDHYRPRIEPVPAFEGPNKILMHVPGPAANEALQIALPPGVLLSTEQQLLLQRAFHDCRAIELQQISGGLSGAHTFLVDARLKVSNAGPRPTPYFAKLDVTSKLREEMQRFREYAEHHIEWHLRPNFVGERCLYGVQEGILVGAFVRGSRSLWEAVLAGEGPQRIRSLFEDTLGGLRQETENLQYEVRGSVVDPIAKFCKHHQVPAARVDAAKVFGGVVHPPSALWRKLLDLPERPWRRAAMHGDMHGENVRVRKDDAIVIDFAHACTGPLSADLASLEVWLAIRVVDGVSSSLQEWRHGIDMLYVPEAIDRALSASASLTDSDPIACSIAEVRRLACASVHSADEYKRVLAVYLLRNATFEADGPYAALYEFRRTYAYWLANRLVLALCAEHEAQLESA